MAGKTKPQDRKPTSTLVDGIYNVKIRGIEVKIERDALDDFELLGDLDDLQSGDAVKSVSVFRRLLGEEQGKQALDALRGENGRVKASDAAVFIYDLFGAINPNS